MEKYGVDESGYGKEKTAERGEDKAEPKCPVCGNSLDTGSPQLVCPHCGTKPFEVKDAEEKD